MWHRLHLSFDTPYGMILAFLMLLLFGLGIAYLCMAAQQRKKEREQNRLNRYQDRK